MGDTINDLGNDPREKRKEGEKMGMPEEPEYQMFEYTCPHCGKHHEEAGSVKCHTDNMTCPFCGKKGSDPKDERPTGTCKHGKFILTEGCPQCIAERQAAEVEIKSSKSKSSRSKTSGSGLTKPNNAPPPKNRPNQ